jgi:ubiquinone biosynthesis protein COQ9
VLAFGPHVMWCMHSLLVHGACMFPIARIFHLYADTWPQAMALMARPENLQTACKLMVQTLSTILSHVNPDADRDAKDPKLYTRFLALQVIYTSTELYMLTDFSPGHADTWQALDRRVEDFLALSSGAQHLERSAMEVLNKLITFGRP